MLDPARAPGDGVVEARDVADRVDVLGGGLEVIVDDDAVIELEAGTLEEPGLRLDANADDGEEGLDLLAEAVTAPVSERPFARNSWICSPSSSSTPCSR